MTTTTRANGTKPPIDLWLRSEIKRRNLRNVTKADKPSLNVSTELGIIVNSNQNRINMKHLFLLIILTASVHASLFSQDCKYVINSVDEVTGQKKVITEQERLALKYQRYELRTSSILVLENQVALYLRSVNVHHLDWVDANGEVIYLMKDGTKHTSKIFQDSRPEKNSMSNKYDLSFTTVLDTKTQNALLSDSLSLLRFYYDDGKYDEYKIKDENSMNISKQIGCVLNEMK